MRPPNGQLGDPRRGHELERITRPYSARRRIALVVSPTYASFRSPFIGRPERFIPGGGATLEFDVQVARWLWLRAIGSYSAHPVTERSRVNDDDEVERRANAGVLQTGHLGLSGVYPLDLGRFVPQLDVGAGVMWIDAPEAAIAGQLGAPCRTGNVCDFGLSCNATAVCELSPQPELHAGLAVDYLIGERWTVGAHFRYFALLGNLSEIGSSFPVYLQLAARLAVRF